MSNARVYSGVLVGVFAVCAVILLTAVPTLYLIAQRSERTRRAVIADACAMELEQVADADDATFEARARVTEERYGVERVTVTSDARQTKGTEVRRVGDRVVRIEFGGDALAEPRRLLQVASAAAGAAVLAGLALLLMSLKSTPVRMSGSVDGGKHGDAEYLFQTFETSIRSMKDRQSELQQMRKLEKERADELEAVTRMLVRSMTSGFIAIGPDGRIVDMNDQAREMLGVPANRITERGTVIEALGDGAFARKLQDAVDTGSPLQREVIPIREEGPVFGLTTVPLRDEQDRYFGMLALFVDLAPMRKLESRVRALQSLADIGEMSAGIAHEFRNSLSTIMGYLRLARRDALPKERDDRLAKAEAEADVLNSAVTSLLNFARPVSLQLQPVDVMDIVRSVAEQQQTTSPSIDVRCEGPPVVIEADSALLRRAIENVVRNAAEAVAARHASGGEIDIVSSRTAEGSRITIRDNGTGLNSSDAARLFLPFQSTKPSGFGLGLALTKKIVLLHGGSVELEGNPDGGAVFTMEFTQGSSSIP